MKSVFFTFVVLSLFLFIAPVAAEDIPPATPAPASPISPLIRPCLVTSATQAGNLLINGDIDDAAYPFYWRPTNHFVAGMWYEWWAGDQLPEFIDGGHPHHNNCYPAPPPGGLCHAYGNHSQAYIRYGGYFVAGVYQIVHNVTPCAFYRFEAYNTNEYEGMRAKVGIEPTGWQLPILTKANPPQNCPPTGSSKCPDPRIDSEAVFPATMVWSPVTEDQLWHPLSVSAEALSSTITVWTYAATRGDKVSHSAYWDYMTLTQSAYPGASLPTPQSWNSTYIQSMNVTFVLDKAVVTWITAEPTYGQVWYTHNPADNSTYTSFSAVEPFPTTHHLIEIEGIQEAGDTVLVAALARRASGGQCVTEALAQTATSPEKRDQGLTTWQPSPIFKNVTATRTGSSVQVSWDTTISTTTQLWYTVLDPPTPPVSGTMLLGDTIFFPIVVVNRHQYPYATTYKLTPLTHHSATITGLAADQTVHFVAAASYSTDYIITTVVSEDYKR